MKKLVLLAFIGLIFSPLFSQDEAPKKADVFVGLHGSALFANYHFKNGSLYGQGSFDPVLSGLGGLDFRAHLTETMFFSLEASFWARKMRSDDQFALLIPALNTNVYYRIDGEQKFIETTLGLGYRHPVASNWKPYLVGGLSMGFPLDKTVDQTQYFFGVSTENDLKTPNPEFGGFAELGIFLPIGERSRLNFGFRFTGSTTNVKVYELVSVRTIAQNVGLRRMQLGLGFSRRI